MADEADPNMDITDDLTLDELTVAMILERLDDTFMGMEVTPEIGITEVVDKLVVVVVAITLDDIDCDPSAVLALSAAAMIGLNMT